MPANDPARAEARFMLDAAMLADEDASGPGNGIGLRSGAYFPADWRRIARALRIAAAVIAPDEATAIAVGRAAASAGEEWNSEAYPERIGCAALAALAGTPSAPDHNTNTEKE